MNLINIQQQDIALMIGTVIVIVVSGNLFNSWTKRYAEIYGYSDEPRHYTTYLRFNSYRAIYIIIMLGSYFFLVYFPDMLVPFGKVSKDYIEEISNQINLWAALIVTGVVPYFPGIQKGEGLLREWLQKKAFTPTFAETFIEILKNHAHAFVPKHEVIESIIKKIGKNIYYNGDFTNGRTDLLRHKWCKLSYLFTMIKNKKQDPHFKQYTECCDKKLFKNIEEDYNELSRVIDARIEQVERKVLGKETKNLTKPLASLLENLEEETSKKLDMLLERCYRVISCGILTTKKLKTDRTGAFESFGLDPKQFEGAKPINWDAVLKSCMIIFGTTFIPTLAYFYIGSLFPEPPKIFPQSALEALAWSLLALFMFGLSLVGSIIVERVAWKHQAGKKIAIGPMKNLTLHAFLSACIGYIISFGVLLLYRLMKGESIMTEQWLMIVLFPVIPSVSSFLVTYFLESPKIQYLKGIPRRIAATISLGFCNALVGVLVLLVLEKTEFWSIFYIAGIAGLIGAGIGYSFIEVYCLHLRPEKDRREQPRFEVAEDAELIMGGETHVCNVTAIGASFVTVDIPVKDDKKTGHLTIKPIGEIPVLVSRRRQKMTILQLLLDKISQAKLDNYLMHIERGNIKRGLKLTQQMAAT